MARKLGEASLADLRGLRSVAESATGARVRSSMEPEPHLERSTDAMILAREALGAIRARLADLDRQARTPRLSGRRAALWRAQHEAARRGRTLRDLRGYCLDSLKHPRWLDVEDENDYLRGYRQGLQQVLSEIREVERRRVGGV
jgi:hypothetical protein